MFTLRLLGNASLDGPDGPVAGRAGLRQRVALLALLAVEHPRPLSRDKLVADLWPESGTDDARHLLRESLYILRSALGDDSVLGTGDDLRLNPDRLTCDLWEFEAALARDDPEAAVGLYHGPFLSGFHLTDAEEFDPWAEGERSRLARRYSQALEQLAEREMRGGDRLRAVEWWSRLTAEDPYNSRIALGYMQALEAAGDRAGALRHASVHSELLRTDLDAVPEREVVALAERLRLESRSAPGGMTAPTQSLPAAPLAPNGDRPESLPAAVAAESGRPPRPGWVLPAMLGLAVVIGFGVVGGALSRERAPELIPRRVAVAVFENHTGRPDLDDLGSMSADWIIRGMLETPLIDVTDLEAVYADGPDDSVGGTDPRTLARRSGAGLVISGNYYRSGDSVLFHAGLVDVASGRVLRSFPTVGAPLENADAAIEALREGIASGVGALVSPHLAPTAEPDLVSPLNLAAYREFMAGLRVAKLNDWEAEFRHYRRAAQLDSTFVAPLIELALRAFLIDKCHLTDSAGTALDRRRERLTTWDRNAIDALRARCRGDMETAVRLLGKSFDAHPRSKRAQGVYAAVLLHSNRPKAAREILRRRDPSGAPLPPPLHYGQFWFMAATHHVLGHYRDELDITDRWRDSSDGRWWIIRGRAMSALGQEPEVLEMFQGMIASPIDSVAELILEMATELAVHGHRQAAATVAESILVRLEAGQPGVDSGRALDIAWANRLLGRKNEERAALERMPAGDLENTEWLEGLARLALLVGDTAEADRIDGILAEQNREPIRSPWLHGARLIARAHIAAGLGRREQAVARLQEAGDQGMLYFGAAYASHVDLLLAPLRGYPPFEALLKPDN